jgi:hypothetical protein
MSSQPNQQQPETLDRLLERIRWALAQDPHYTKKRLADCMYELASVANHLAGWRGKTRATTEVGEITGSQGEFKLYLERRRLAPNTVQIKLSGRNLLLRYARKFGMAPGSFALEDEWKPIQVAVEGHCGVPSLIKDALERRIPTNRYSDDDLADWGKRALTRRRTWDYVQKVQTQFRLVLRRTGLCKQFPRLRVEVKKNPSIRLPLDRMPAKFRGEIDASLAWMRKEAKREVLRMNATTERSVVWYFEEFVGFYVNVWKRRLSPKRRLPPKQFSYLLTQEYIEAYVKWIKETARCKKPAIRHRLAPIDIALRFYPKFAALDGGLCRRALKPLVKEPESAATIRRRKREIHHDRLVEITEALQQKRAASDGVSPVERAWLCHDELLMLFLTWYPWYSRCLCRCRFRGPHPNLFKGPILDDQLLALTPSALEQRKADPAAEFWQFSFSAVETPYSNPVHGLMPDAFVSILNDYSTVHHPLLTGKSGAKTLFLNRARGPMREEQLHRTIGNLTIKRGFRQVTPTACRAIFAYYWLKKYPQDYVGLAEILWMSVPALMNQYPPKSPTGQPSDRAPF